MLLKELVTTIVMALFCCGTKQKLRLQTFIDHADSFGFSVMDSTYGFNQSKFSGYLSMNRGVCECNIEIYHEGNMVYVEE